MTAKTFDRINSQRFSPFILAGMLLLLSALVACGPSPEELAAGGGPALEFRLGTRRPANCAHRGFRDGDRGHRRSVGGRPR